MLGENIPDAVKYPDDLCPCLGCVMRYSTAIGKVTLSKRDPFVPHVGIALTPPNLWDSERLVEEMVRE